MKIGAIVQARMSSTRLHGKVLKKLPYYSSLTVLQQIIRRLKKSHSLDEIVIATTRDRADKKITKIAAIENVKWFRGSTEDVLERYYLAAKENNLDVIVRITGDCPCVDPEIVDSIITEHWKTGADYTTNALVRSFPHGLDIEVINFNTLEKAHQEAKHKLEREHVTLYIYKTKKDQFKITAIEAPPELYSPDIRITLDTEEDYTLLCAVYDNLYHSDRLFSAKDIITLFREKAWLKLINKKTMQKKIFETFDEEVEEALKMLDLQELKKTKKFLEENRKIVETPQLI